MAALGVRGIAAALLPSLISPFRPGHEGGIYQPLALGPGLTKWLKRLRLFFLFFAPAYYLRPPLVAPS